MLLLATLVCPAMSGAQTPAASAEDDAAYYFLLGRRYESAGDADKAITAYKQALKLAPDSAELRAELAGVYAREDRAVEAVESAEEALKKDPRNREANRILGSIFAALAEQRQSLRPGDDPAL